jgi:hypothetical protein
MLMENQGDVIKGRGPSAATRFALSVLARLKFSIKSLPVANASLAVETAVLRVSKEVRLMLRVSTSRFLNTFAAAAGCNIHLPLSRKG